MEYDVLLLGLCTNSTLVSFVEDIEHVLVVAVGCMQTVPIGHFI